MYKRQVVEGADPLATLVGRQAQHRALVDTGAECVQRTDQREGVLALAGAQIVLGVAAEFGGRGAYVVVRDEVGAAVGVGEEAGQDRVGGRFAGAVVEEVGERVLGLGLVPRFLVTRTEQLHELDGEAAQDGDLDLVEGDRGAPLGQGLEVAGHQRSC